MTTMKMTIKKNLEKKAAGTQVSGDRQRSFDRREGVDAQTRLNRNEALTHVAIYKLCRQLKKNQIIIFAMNDDDDANLIFAADFTALWKVEKGPISLYVFVKKHATINFFDQFELSGLDLHIIDENDLACRQLFGDFTLMSCVGQLDSLRVGVVGYTDISENLYKNIAFWGSVRVTA